jgi:hypothetical protein
MLLAMVDSQQTVKWQIVRFSVLRGQRCPFTKARITAALCAATVAETGTVSDCRCGP